MGNDKNNGEKKPQDENVADPKDPEREEDLNKVDEELDETFPASDPPANY